MTLRPDARLILQIALFIGVLGIPLVLLGKCVGIVG